MWFRPRAALLLLLATLLAKAASAAPVLKIKGEARIDATAGWLDGRLIVSGVARDDTGRPLPGAELRVKGLSEGGRPVGLAAGSACSPLAGADSVPRAAGEERAFRADRQGRFCVDFAGAPADAIEIRLVDGRGFIDSPSRRIAVDRTRRGVELRFVDPPTRLDLDQRAVELELAARTEPTLPGTLPPLRLTLLARDRNGVRPLATSACSLGDTARTRIVAEELGEPGPIELVLGFAGTESLQPADAALRVPRTASVVLALREPVEPSDPEAGVELELSVEWSRGKVNSGSVEARFRGETVGIAKVEGGRASLSARFARGRAERAELLLHYLPSEPWWVPAPPLDIEVPLTPKSRWASVLWLLGLFLIGGWLLTGWRRPARARRKPPAVPAPKTRSAAVVVVEARDDDTGWRGTVRDAHEEVPIRDASISIVVDADGGQRTLARATSDERGEFALPQLPPQEHLRFVASARLYATLSSPMPHAGRLMVDLVTRRRQLVARFLSWAAREGRRAEGRSEPTPGEVRSQAEREKHAAVAAWAGAVEAAAYGPDPVDEPAEKRVLDREPKPAKAERH